MNLLARRRIWWSVALLTGLAVALTSGAGLVVRLVGQVARSTATYTGVRQLDMNVSLGSVSIMAGPPGQVTVTEAMKWTTTRPTVDVVPDLQSHTLEIRVQCDGGGPLSAWDCGVGLVIRVPPETAVRSLTGSGATYVSGLSGALDLSSASGSITVQQVSGSLLAATTSGSIDATGLRSPSVVAETRSGSMDLGFSRPPQDVHVATSSGSVDLLLPRQSRYRVTQNAASRRVDIVPGLVDSSSANSLGITTNSGSVDVAYG